MKQSSVFSNPWIWLVLCITLGLAPFTPEPHVWEKIKWIVAGADGMRPIDWFDLVLHGTPWIILLWIIIKRFVGRQQ